MTSAAPVEIPGTSTRSLGLDHLRIFAAAWVVVFHWGNFYFPFESAWDPAGAFVRAGYLGVDLFFLLSGAVIAHSAMRRSWSSFARARFLRLFPAYFAVALLVVVGFFLVGAAEGETRALDAGVVMGLTGLVFWTDAELIIAPSWTLFYEVNFYILIALLILAVRNDLTLQRMLGASYVYFVLWILATASGDALLSLVTISPFGPLFVLGALLGTSTSRELLQKNGPAIVIALAMSYYVLMGRTAEMGVSGFEQVLWILAILTLASSIILWSSLRRSDSRKHARARKLVQTLSLMTYPVYLLHLEVGWAIIRQVESLGFGVPAGIAASTFVILVLAWMSVRWYEPWARARIRQALGWVDDRRVLPSAETPGDQRTESSDSAVSRSPLT